jgi:hypothetical protein
VKGDKPKIYIYSLQTIERGYSLHSIITFGAFQQYSPLEINRGSERNENTHWPHVVGTKANPIAHSLILCEYPTSSRMSYNPILYLFENPIRHRMSEEPLHIDLCKTDFLSDLGKGCGFIDRKRLGCSSVEFLIGKEG